MSSIFAIYFCMLVLHVTYCYKAFDNISLYEVTAFNSQERAFLYYLYVKEEMIVFLNGITNEAALPMDVVVDECCTRYFEEKLIANNIEYVKLPKKNL